MAGNFTYISLSDLPDDYSTKIKSNPDEILKQCKTSKQFEQGALGKLEPIPWPLFLERIFGNAFYIGLHLVPTTLMAYGACKLMDLPWGASQVIETASIGVFTYLVALGGACVVTKTLQGPFLSKTDSVTLSMRNTEKFLSIRAIWPPSCAPEKMRDTPAIYCAVPHGMVPSGVWSPFFRLWASKAFRWTAAPIVFQLPFISYWFYQAGFMPAKGPQIKKELTDKKHSVGVILDGVAGIFSDKLDAEKQRKERVFMRERKGVVAIALQTGAPLVPVYMFGHTDMYTVLTDPFGIIEGVSCKLNMALAPFVGLWGFPLGPPRRRPILLAFGDPIQIPKNPTGAKPSSEEVDKYHEMLVQGVISVFETHKAAYGWPDKQLEVI